MSEPGQPDQQSHEASDGPSETLAPERLYYDAYWESEGWHCVPPRRLVELFERYVSSSDHCLDVGCGDGGTSGSWLDKHVDRYLGVDISEHAIRMARDRGLEVRVIGDAAALPLPDQEFDIVVCTEVLEHLFEPQRALSEIWRVLRPGGRVIVSVPNAVYWRTRLDIALLGRWNPRGDHLSPTQPWRDPHVRFFTLRSLTNLMNESGLAVLEAGGDAHFAFHQHLPGVRRLARKPLAGSVTRGLAARFPRLLAETLYVVGQRGPAGG